jgi:hypothetical protein
MGARIRTIKPDFWDDDKIAALSRPARLTFLGLISAMSDDEGRCRGNPRAVRAAVYPLDDDISIDEIDSHLGELQHGGLIIRYVVKDQPYIQIVNFTRHQRIQKPTPSQVPPMSSSDVVAVCDDSHTTTGRVADGSSTAPPVVEGNGMEREVKNAALESAPEPTVDQLDAPTPVKANPSKADARAFPKSTCDRLYEAWLATGHTVDYARFRKALLPLYPEAGPRYTEQQIKAAIVAFNEAADGASADKSQFWHVNKFVEDIGRWVRLGAMPLADSSGLTERGRTVVGAV